MKAILKLGGWMLLAAFFSGDASAGSAPAASFVLRFDSTTTSDGGEAFIRARVQSGFLLDPVEGQLGRYQGAGRLRYTELQGLTGGFGSDGVLEVYEMTVDSEDGTVTMSWFPGDPKPNEWLIFPPAPPLPFFQWFGVFGFFHIDELGVGGFTITEWEYPEGDDVYARATYQQTQSKGDVTNTETTIIELIPVTERPRIDRIKVESAGQSQPDPETGERVDLSADLFVPFPFEVERCTWTGNNFTGPGEGNPENNCLWDYTPRADEGPRRDTYGDKNVTLTVVYRFGAQMAAVEDLKSKDYKVFFTKKGDDDSNGQPNWFDYWGDDEAVPSLDDSDIEFDSALSDFGVFRGGSKVFVGPSAADTDSELVITATTTCPGGTFPAAQGIDLAAITVAHERRHKELSQLGGTDTDNDGVPDSEEGSTDPNDPDSCNLASQIHPDYSTYGDDEFVARQAELGVSGNPSNDWAVPGRQATLSKSLRASQKRIQTSGSPSQATAHSSHQHEHEHEPGKGLGADVLGNYDASGDDTDGDGLFNQLLLDVDISVVETNRYSLIAWLADDNGTEVAWGRTTADLEPGSHTLTIAVDGVPLNQAAALQTLAVSRVELGAWVGKHNVSQALVEDPFQTPFVSADFDPPSATIAGVGVETTVDEGTDNLFDRMDVPVDLAINDPGDYMISAVLRGGSLSLVSRASTSLERGASPVQVTLSFDGASIAYFREDGPYELVNLRLTNRANGAELDFVPTALTTAPYAASSFQRTNITVDENSYADAGGSINSEGRFETLDITFAIDFDFQALTNPDAFSPGLYDVRLSLEDDLGRTISRTSVSVVMGNADPDTSQPEERVTVSASFAGGDIAAADVGGPYQVSRVFVVSDEGIVVDHNPIPYLTAPYLATDFAGPDDVIFSSNFELPEG